MTRCTDHLDTQSGCTEMVHYDDGIILSGLIYSRECQELELFPTQDVLNLVTVIAQV
jgi:hypothetical protein